jgi:hypothetical protein
MKEKGVKIRYITEITKENVNYCKELMNFSEVRHLDEVKGNFGVLDGIYYRASAKLTASSPPPLVISNTVRAFVEQQQYFFDMLWRKAIPAKERIGASNRSTNFGHRSWGCNPEYIPELFR